jgi:alkylation response protein AidB-like acyl-CoA dehydrogenase
LSTEEHEVFVFRRNDYSLSEEQNALKDAYRRVFEDNSPSELVRKSEPVGFDDGLWALLNEMGTLAMGVPVAHDGDGAGLVELALVAEEAGRRMAPVPLVEATVAARLLGRLADEGVSAASPILASMLEGEIVTLAVGSDTAPAGRQLVPGGAVARTVLGLDGDRLVVARADASPSHVENLACAPLAWWDLRGAETLLDGPAAQALFATARDEWRVLTAAALLGVGQTALDLAAQYAKDRFAFGVPIGSFQAVAHPLADVLMGLVCARRLTHKAAWFLDFEPSEVRARVSMAYYSAAEAAERAGSVGIHTQGGFGFTLESDEQLLYRRAKGWPMVAGGRRAELQLIADRLLADPATGKGSSA